MRTANSSPPKPRERVDAAQTARYPMPEQHEQAIAREVAETIVDQLEAVAVDEQQSEARRCALSAICNGLLKPVQE
jgi:hypothetical protein